MNSNLKYYSPSSQTTSGLLIGAFLILFFLVYPLAIAYTVIVLVMPFAFVNGVITGLAAMTIVFCARSIGKLMKMRTPREFRNLVMFSVFIFWYFSWIIFSSIYIEGFSGGKNWILHSDLFFRPDLLAKVIAANYEVGLRIIFGANFNNWQLVLVWVIEVAILFFVSYFLIKRKLIPPFSNRLNKWYPKYNLRQYFEYVVTANQFKIDIESHYMNAINALGKGMAHRYGQVSIYYLKDDADAYLSFTNISIEGHGTGKRNENTIIHTLRISPYDAATLMEKYKTEKEFFLDN